MCSPLKTLSGNDLRLLSRRESISKLDSPSNMPYGNDLRLLKDSWSFSSPYSPAKSPRLRCLIFLPVLSPLLPLIFNSLMRERCDDVTFWHRDTPRISSNIALTTCGVLPQTEEKGVSGGGGDIGLGVDMGGDIGLGVDMAGVGVCVGVSLTFLTLVG